MQVGALGPYEHTLLTASPLALLGDDGTSTALEVERWLAPVDAADRSVLDRCTGPALDVGCGPGRFVAALSDLGIDATGVDIAETAVRMTRRRGVSAVLRDVFAPMPREGSWRTVLLMDGNIGIGGDPLRLLARVQALLSAGGRVLVETHDDPLADRAMSVRFSQHGETVGPTFPWAQVGLLPILDYARRLGFGTPDVWTAHGRSYVGLPSS